MCCVVAWCCAVLRCVAVNLRVVLLRCGVLRCRVVLCCVKGESTNIVAVVKFFPGGNRRVSSLFVHAGEGRNIFFAK